jgi:hypothetical protein
MMFKTAGAAAFVLATTLAASACAYDTYDNRGRYGTVSNARNERAAFDTGYRDGLRQGRADGRDGDRFDPRGQREYRTADNGRWGSRYDDEYRQGFASGYERGYRDARNTSGGQRRGRRR